MNLVGQLFCGSAPRELRRGNSDLTPIVVGFLLILFIYISPDKYNGLSITEGYMNESQNMNAIGQEQIVSVRHTGITILLCRLGRLTGDVIIILYNRCSILCTSLIQEIR